MLTQRKSRISIVAAAAMIFAAAPVFGGQPKYKADVPVSILTPDSVQTKYIGELKFVDGFPTDETLKKVSQSFGS